MADVKEKDLSAKSSLTGSDYLRVTGSDNVSYKQLVSDVAKYIVENYTGSSVAGSAQSIKSALDALNSRGGINGNIYYYNSSTVDINTVEHNAPGLKYYGSSCRNVPEDYIYVLTLSAYAAGDIVQVGFAVSTKIYIRKTKKDGSNFGNWVLIATA